MKSFSLTKVVQILLFFFLLFTSLHYAKPFLAPFAIATILAMLFLPIARKLENKGLSKGISIAACLLILVVAIAGIVLLLSTQIAGISEDFPKIKQNVSQTISNLKNYISKTVGVSPEQQQQMLEKQKQSGGGSTGSVVTSILNSLSSFLVDTILVFVYIFLLMSLRRHIKKFILKLVSPEQEEKTRNVIANSTEVAHKYLTGIGMMIVMLWVMYGIGFSIVGVKNAIFFAILCGLLEIVPFVGNLVGTGLTLIMVLSQGGGTGMVIGVLITYALVQFIQTYIIEPLIVGSEVNINPLFTIIVIVVGELVWGVAGMILAIPMLGIVKVICDNVNALKPYGFLIGEEKSESNNGLIDKIKGWFK